MFAWKFVRLSKIQQWDIDNMKRSRKLNCKEFQNCQGVAKPSQGQFKMANIRSTQGIRSKGKLEILLFLSWYRVKTGLK